MNVIIKLWDAFPEIYLIYIYLHCIFKYSIWESRTGVINVNTKLDLSNVLKYTS